VSEKRFIKRASQFAIFKAAKPSGVRPERHVTQAGSIIKAFQILIAKPERKSQLKRLQIVAQ
jgi:hypothetical protein